MPTGVMSTLSAFIFSYIGAKWANRRCLVTIGACIVPIIGTVIVYTVDRKNIAGQMVGIYLVSYSACSCDVQEILFVYQLYTYFGPYVIGIGLGQANTAGHTKKTVTFAILYIGYAVGNLIGPQTFRASQAPAYTGGVVAMIVCYCVCIGLISLYWAFCVFKNKKRGGVYSYARNNEEAIQELLDETDFQQERFLYTT